MDRAVEIPRLRDAFLEELRSLGPGDECVYWPWSDKRAGYVYIHVNHVKSLAHRWVYQQVNGPLPVVSHTGPRGDAVQVCHTCDNPPCIRPSHLFAGTGTDNIRDAVAKGRMKGRMFTSQRPRLSRDQVKTIRFLLEAGLSQQRVADMMNIGRMTVNRIATNSMYRKHQS